jgi:APA family basic amino acid/polyamine antiporter
LELVSASDPGTPPTARLGLWPATALVVGHTIAVGIFLTPAEVIGAVASPILTVGLWAACGTLVLAGAFTFGELASRFPLGGGPYIYLREGWGDRVAFLYGWQSVLVMDPGVTAALASGLSDYGVLLWPSAAGAERGLALAVIWTLAIVSMAGITVSARVLEIVTGVKVLAFAVVVVMAFAAGTGSWSHFEPLAGRQASTVPLGEAIALGLVSVFFSFGGFWEASRVTAEVDDPRRTMPKALAAGVACVTLIYTAMTIAFVYLVPVRQVTTASEFARRAGEAMLGPPGPAALAAIVVLSASASALALLIMAPRLYVAMGRDGLFPSSLSSLNRVTQSPVRATALLAALASVFVSMGTFQQIVPFFMCTTLGFVALAAAALIVVRRRPQADPPFQAPGYPFTTLLFVMLVLAVVGLVAINRPREAIAGFAIVLLGLPAYRLFGRPHAPTPRHS